MKNFYQVSVFDYRIKFKNLVFAVVAFFLFLLCAVCAFGQTFNGNVVQWFDGDTITIRAVGGKYYRVRLAGIDAPESRQTHGVFCRNLLRDVTEKRTVVVDLFGKDVYKRWLGRIFVQTNTPDKPDIPDLSLWLIENGCAWEYGAALDVKTEYQTAEGIARAGEVGLWLDPNPMSPITFRTGGNCP